MTLQLPTRDLSGIAHISDASSGLIHLRDAAPTKLFRHAKNGHRRRASPPDRRRRS